VTMSEEHIEVPIEEMEPALNDKVVVIGDWGDPLDIFIDVAYYRGNGEWEFTTPSLAYENGKTPFVRAWQPL